MKKEVTYGMNKTGIAMAPNLAAEMAEGADRLTMPPEGTELDLANERTRLTRASDPVGSVPLPASIKGVVNAGAQFLHGGSAKFLIDKLGERLAFERAGTRLYEALLSKRRAESDIDSFPIDTLERFRNDELGHFHLVEQTIRDIGGDPTAVTPCADVTAVASLGLQQVMTDPKIKFHQALQAMLIAELTDNDGWELLIRLVREAGMEDVADKFEAALLVEQEHLLVIRQWIEQSILPEEEERQSA